MCKTLVLLLLITITAKSQGWVGWGGRNAKNLSSGATIGHPNGGGVTTVIDEFTIDSTITINVGTDGFTIQTGSEFVAPAWWAFDTNGGHAGLSNNDKVYIGWGASGLTIREHMNFVFGQQLQFNDGFKIHNSVTAELKILDWANNELMKLTDNGTTGTLDVTGDVDVTGNVKKGGTNYTHPDYVFDPNYALMPLEELKKYIEKHKSLPGVSSAEDIKKQGYIKIDEMARVNLEKIEELTLYILDLKKRLDLLKTEIILLREIKDNQKI